jgi:hypothetical protein
MILAIWEGTPHRQMLDALEVMERKQAHRLLLRELGASSPEQQAMERRIDSHLALPQIQREATAEPLFRDLAQLTAESLLNSST